MSSLPSNNTGTWIWHPDWVEGADKASAGGFVHFRKSITLTSESLPTEAVPLHISADTRYKLYINSHLVSIGPVKGDEHLWFYDEIDIQPYLKVGINHFSVRVLRFYYASPSATSFPRLPYAGLLIRTFGPQSGIGHDIQSHNDWQTALDLSTYLPINIKEDDFLHVYENVHNEKGALLEWKAAKQYEFPASHGITAPWKLSPRLIPTARYAPKGFTALHNVRSTEPLPRWEKTLLSHNKDSPSSIRLPAGSTHHIELEVEHHITAFLDFRFERPTHSGSRLKITYSECYEDEPEEVPYIRRKGDRRDTSKMLIGPEDNYAFGGSSAIPDLQYYDHVADEEIFSPFHFRTLRFLAIDITVDEQSDLVFKGISMTTTNYPLDILASFNTPTTQNSTTELWKTSIRTLQKCMHDCYEDCPFYEQLQYAMDIRSSALFTYYLSGDDRAARQAIIQLHNSYDPGSGLTASRAPAHQYQVIPHFSLYWICMITDHFEHFADADFVRQFMAACDGVLESFSRRLDVEIGLVRSLDSSSTYWDFVDWANQWKPYGIPPAAERTGFQTYTNMLYAYTLKRAARLLEAIGRSGLATEYQSRADAVVTGIQTHCFDGQYFTDGLASQSDPDKDLSQHNQVWAVLSGAAKEEIALKILKGSLSSPTHTPTSIAMSFYTLRALSLAGGGIYNETFHTYWDPWRKQLSQNLTTWVEDNVSQRSDCHAWGSAPIFEYLAEVAGVRPASPGWKALVFQPRIALFPELDATIPFGGTSPGVAHVKWNPEGGQTKVTLSLTLNSGEDASIPVQVILPGQGPRSMEYSQELVFLL